MDVHSAELSGHYSEGQREGAWPYHLLVEEHQARNRQLQQHQTEKQQEKLSAQKKSNIILRTRDVNKLCGCFFQTTFKGPVCNTGPQFMIFVLVKAYNILTINALTKIDTRSMRNTVLAQI